MRRGRAGASHRRLTRRRRRLVQRRTPRFTRLSSAARPQRLSRRAHTRPAHTVRAAARAVAAPRSDGLGATSGAGLGAAISDGIGGVLGAGLGDALGDGWRADGRGWRRVAG